MDYGKAFTYVFEDSEWVSKFLIGALLVLASVFIFPIFFVIGYSIEIIQNVVHSKTPVLPTWDNWGDKFSKGFMVFLVGLIYAIPLVLAIIIGVLGIILMAFGGDQEIAPLAITGIVVTIIGFAVAVLYGLFIAVISPSFTIRYALTESISEALDVKEVIRFIRRNPGPYFIAYAILFGFNMVASTFGQICCLVSFAAAFYSYLLSGHLYGQLYLESQKSPAQQN